MKLTSPHLSLGKLQEGSGVESEVDSQQSGNSICLLGTSLTRIPESHGTSIVLEVQIVVAWLGHNDQKMVRHRPNTKDICKHVLAQMSKFELQLHVMSSSNCHCIWCRLEPNWLLLCG